MKIFFRCIIILSDKYYLYFLYPFFAWRECFCCLYFRVQHVHHKNISYQLWIKNSTVNTWSYISHGYLNNSSVLVNENWLTRIHRPKVLFKSCRIYCLNSRNIYITFPSSFVIIKYLDIFLSLHNWNNYSLSYKTSFT